MTQSLFITHFTLIRFRLLKNTLWIYLNWICLHFEVERRNKKQCERPWFRLHMLELLQPMSMPSIKTKILTCWDWPDTNRIWNRNFFSACFLLIVRKGLTQLLTININVWLNLIQREQKNDCVDLSWAVENLRLRENTNFFLTILCSLFLFELIET